jgi:hypothetical protein
LGADTSAAAPKWVAITRHSSGHSIFAECMIQKLVVLSGAQQERRLKWRATKHLIKKLGF